MILSQINVKTRMFSKLKLAEPSKAVAAEWQQLQHHQAREQGKANRAGCLENGNTVLKKNNVGGIGGSGGGFDSVQSARQ
jgi:hypothetical protein